ncbi:glycosyltransferase [Caenibacillus caldisaponilyticus]|uniref:glycosyltransferase n=1 Tax=Caenibacillus caldisaponilyticus TaxID=1674942 RepID=UPI0009883187|nr:glycosyltransferase [Caenibacillus caldisaponilyticus]
MKILQVTESFGGGVYSFLIDLCNDLAKDHDVTVVYSNRKETPKKFINDFDPNIHFIYLNMGINKSIYSILKLVKIIKKIKPDVIHLHSSKAGFVGRIATKICGYKGKVYYNPHGLAYLRKDIPKVVRLILFFVEKIMSNLCELVIGVSKSEKNEIQRFTKNTIYINNGININRFQREISNIKVKNVGNSKIKIGTVGRVEYQKNPGLFNDIAKKFPGLDFIWIGDGSLVHKLSSNNVYCTGWLDRKEVIKKLMEIDIYIQTSLWEGLPISVIEAMYLEKPIIVSNSIGNVDLVSPSLNGFVFNDLNEACLHISNLIKSKALIIKMGKKSKEIVCEKFNIEDTIKNYKKIYFE